MENTARPFKIRENKSVRFATSADLERLTYTRSMSLWMVPQGLRARAVRYLKLFGALICAGDYGYRGTRVLLDKLAYHEHRLNHETRSVRTLQRAIKDLEDGGYIKTRTVRTGRWRQYDINGGGARDPMVEIEFSDKLKALFEGRSPMSDSSTPTTNWPGNDLTSSCDSSLRSESTGNTTHGCARNKDTVSANNNGSDVAGTNSIQEPTSRPASSSQGNFPGTGGRSQLNTSHSAKRHETGRGTAKRKRRNQAKPRTPDRSLPPRTRKERVNKIMSTLARVGAHRPLDESKYVLARAQAEMSIGDPRMLGHSGTNWEFWILRWETVSKPVQEFWARNELWRPLCEYNRIENVVDTLLDESGSPPDASGVSHNQGEPTKGTSDSVSVFAPSCQEPPAATREQLLKRLNNRVKEGEISRDQAKEMFLSFGRFLK